MAILARLWFHFCTTEGWLPAALNPFLPTAIEEQSSRGHLQVETLRKQRYRSMSMSRPLLAVSAA
jgi:hypothetical protein